MTTINDYTEKTTPAGTDELEIQETGGGTSKKITIANLFSKPQAIGDTTPAAGDFTTLDSTGDMTSGADVVATEDVIVGGFLNLGTLDSLTIATGVVTVTQTRNRIAPESGTSDSLVTINGFSDGRVLMLMPRNENDTITCVDATGNLRLDGDFVMDNVRDRILLVYDGEWGSWVEISRSNNQ